jgi:hypothetical protein
MNKFLLENARIQQNQFIDGKWNTSIDTQFPTIKMDVGGMSESQIQTILDGPPMQMRESPPILEKMKFEFFFGMELFKDLKLVPILKSMILTLIHSLLIVKGHYFIF